MSIIGIIGGSGLEDPQVFESQKNVAVKTPYGNPSAPLRYGKIENQEVVILPRHGNGHTVPPSQINNRANIFALKKSGCTHVIATAACGSLRDEIKPGQLVIPDQLIDFTRQRATSFYEVFEAGIENARHTPMAEPFTEFIRKSLQDSACQLNFDAHYGGVLLTIEGPRFSTRAESKMFRIWGADLVNMTIAPEAILAKELSLPYAVVATVTDFDSWKNDALPLRVEDLIRVFKDNVNTLTKLIQHTLPHLNNRACAQSTQA